MKKYASVVPRVCLIYDTHFSHNEYSESVDDGTVVVMTDLKTSDYIPEVVRK